MTEETYELQLSGDGFQIIPMTPGSNSMTVEHILTSSSSHDDSRDNVDHDHVHQILQTTSTDQSEQIFPDSLGHDSALVDEHDGTSALIIAAASPINENQEIEAGEVNLFLEYGANWTEDLLIDLRNISGKVFDYPVFCVDGLVWTNKLVLSSFGALTKTMLSEAHEESCLVLPDIKKQEFELFHKFLFEDTMDLTPHTIQIVSKVGHLLGIPVQDTSIINELYGTFDYQNLFDKQKYEYISKTLGIHEAVDLIDRLSNRKKIFRKAKWQNLDRQLGEKYENGQLTISCDECGRVFSDNNLLNSHIETVHKRKESREIKKQFPCKYCHHTFAFELNIKRHMFLVHPNGAENQDFVAKMPIIESRIAKGEPIYEEDDDQLVDLVNDITKDKENQFEKMDEFKCKVCGEYQKSRRFLVIHMTEHFDTKIGTHGFKCDYPDCSSSFKEQSKLRRHKIVHSGLKPFKCEFCDMKFSLKHNMKMHIKTHTKEGLFECKYCDYQTVQKINLKSHENAHIKLGHKTTKDPDLQTEQQLSKPTLAKGKYSSSLQKKATIKIENVETRRKFAEKQDIIDGFEEMEQEEEGPMPEKDLIIHQHEHSDITVETNDEIEKFIAEMERENSDEISKSAVDIHQLDIKME